MKRAITAAAVFALLALSGCGDMALRDMIVDLVTRASYMPSFTGGVAIKAVGDSFTMGDGAYGPNVSESLSYNFTMSKYEITHSQFAQFIADGGYTTQSYWTTNGWNYKQSQGWTQPAYWTDANFNGANQPVVGVSWYEAVAYCNWRSQKEFFTPAYDSTGHATLGAWGYRLPTEVEWEYAAAKGASTETERLWAYSGGTSPPFDPSKVVCGALKTADVGSKSTAGDTPQGLADMSGNVWEWCSDNNQSDASITIGTDRYYFVDDSTGQLFLVRGGALYDTLENYFRCAYRNLDFPSDRYNAIGFRVVRP
ncbi:MAG: SUMF1/EgtB/PvdO family nonheme iron enzyme [Spirochaetes bacterium]|nr:SUMF1/EgtB/PvdO family nonheme iron enzyme [Spirochaetota bacterium]